MKYYLEPKAWSQVVAMPNILVDQYIKLAGKAQLRVILYILRHCGEEIPEGSLSDALALHPDEVAQALIFWQEAGILRSQQDKDDLHTNQTTVQVPITRNPQALATAQETVAPAKSRHIITRSPMNDPAVVARRIQESAEIKTLLEEAEVILEKHLRTWEADILINLHDADEMPVDVIIMVLHYARARGKTTIRYIEKTAQNWMEEGVDTIEKAEQKIHLIQAAASAWQRICRLFQIEARKPSTKEEEYALRWLEEWKLSDELLLLAYDRCADSTGKMKFAYMNKILQRWANEGYTTVAQVEAGEKPSVKPEKTKQSRTGAKPNSSYDLEVFEQILMGENLVSSEKGMREEEA